MLVSYSLLTDFIKSLRNWFSFSIWHHIDNLFRQLIDFRSFFHVFVLLFVDLLGYFLASDWLILLVSFLISQKLIESSDLGWLRDIHATIKHHLPTESLWSESALWLLLVVSIHLLFQISFFFHLMEFISSLQKVVLRKLFVVLKLHQFLFSEQPDDLVPLFFIHLLNHFSIRLIEIFSYPFLFHLWSVCFWVEITPGRLPGKFWNLKFINWLWQCPRPVPKSVLFVFWQRLLKIELRAICHIILSRLMALPSRIWKIRAQIIIFRLILIVKVTANRIELHHRLIFIENWVNRWHLELSLIHASTLAIK